jgi:hypothetical protein
MKIKRFFVFQIFFYTLIFVFSCKTPELTFPINSSQVADDYGKSKRKSNRKYQYKEIIVQGTLSEMYKNKNDEIVLYLADVKDVNGVKCTLDKEKQKITTPLKLHETLTIKGFCVGYFENVEIKKCEIITEK